MKNNNFIQNTKNVIISGTAYEIRYCPLCKRKVGKKFTLGQWLMLSFLISLVWSLGAIIFYFCFHSLGFGLAFTLMLFFDLICAIPIVFLYVWKHARKCPICACPTIAFSNNAATKKEDIANANNIDDKSNIIDKKEINNHKDINFSKTKSKIN